MVARVAIGYVTNLTNPKNGLIFYHSVHLKPVSLVAAQLGSFFQLIEVEKELLEGPYFRHTTGEGNLEEIDRRN